MEGRNTRSQLLRRLHDPGALDLDVFAGSAPSDRCRRDQRLALKPAGDNALGLRTADYVKRCFKLAVRRRKVHRTNEYHYLEHCLHPREWFAPPFAGRAYTNRAALQQSCCNAANATCRGPLCEALSAKPLSRRLRPPLVPCTPLLYTLIHVFALEHSFRPHRFRGRDRARPLFRSAASRPYRRSPGSLKERPAVDLPLEAHAPCHHR